MFGIRYHIATLCAMFLMLAVGFWVGALSNVGQTFTKQETVTIHGMSTKLDSVLQAADQDHTLLRQDEAAIAALTPKLVAGRLDGKRIAIVRTGDYAGAMQSAADAITAAGGIVVSQSTVTGRADMLGEADRAKIVGGLKSTPPDGDNSVSDIVHPLLAALRVGTAAHPDLVTDLGMLSDGGLIETSGDYSSPVSAVVIVGGSLSGGALPPASGAGDSPTDINQVTVESAVLTALTATGEGSLLVVGCESSDAAVSSETAFSQAGIASVDCIDLPLGALDLPFALRRGDQTAYGEKSTATRLIPAALQSADAQQGTQ